MMTKPNDLSNIAFNRTIVELKPRWAVIISMVFQTFNRTIVELKLKRLSRVDDR